MRQTLMIAAIHMAYAIGVRQKAWGLTGKVGTSDAGLKEEFMQFVEPATEMFEVAEELAMKKPEDAERHVYDDIAARWATHCREEQKFPTREEMFAIMAKSIYNVFEDSLSNTQRELLTKKLAEFE